MNIITVTPRVSEKAYRQAGESNTYVFDAPLAANKNQIIDAVESQYDVKVASVRTLVQSGKSVRYSRGKRRYPGTTHRRDNKKAYVTLVEGDSIKVFDEATEQQLQAEAGESEEK